MAEFRLPSPSERAVVFGRTGSGKTVFLTWLLSHASITERPWIVIDHKNDDYLGSLPHIRQIKIGELPKAPGLYIIRPSFRDDDRLDEYLHAILAHGDTGVFTDEGASLPQAEPRYLGLKALFAQGRSKRTPILLASQRPVRLNRSIVSEGDFYACLHLQHAGDRATARQFMPDAVERRLDDYHAHWYDVKKDAYFIVRPVNNDDTMQRLDERLRPRLRLL